MHYLSNAYFFLRNTVFIMWIKVEIQEFSTIIVTS